MYYSSNFINIKPISINSCFVGRRFKTKEFSAWQEAVLWKLPRIEKTIKNRKLGIRMYFYLKHPTKQDGDNLIKAAIDCLVKAEIIEDDRYIFYYEVFKRKTEKEEGFEIEIIET